MSRVPRIRFKGFEEDWEQRKLGEVADIIGGGTPSTLNSDYWDGNIDWYSPAEIIDQIYVYRSQRKITELGFEKSSAKMLPEGTVLFTSRAGIGKTVILAKKGCTNQGFQSIVPYSNKLDSYFIFSRTEELKKYGELVGAGSTFVEVSGRQMENMQLMIPKTIGEQHIIGVLFSTFDHLITLHQRKLEKLKIIKKSMLENLFPQNGEKTPKIRFSGFTEDWEQRKLGDIVREVTRVDENSNAPVMMITANDGFIEQSERYSTDNAGRSLKKYILLKKWELAYNHGASKIRPFGSCFALTRAANIRIPFVYHCFLALEDNPEFLEYTLNSKNVENQLRKIVSSGARMDGLLNISFQEYTSIFIRCPIRKEQDIIAILIKSLDHIITLHQLEPFQLIFKAIAYRIIDYAKSKPLNSTK